MSGLTCHEARLTLGVYVVGAIDPAERALVDEHLSRCPECREELAGLAGLPALLGRVPIADAERLVRSGADARQPEVPSAELLRSLLGQVAARRKVRRWRMLTAAAAAAVIAVGGGLAAGFAMSGHGHQPIPSTATKLPWPERVRATNVVSHVSADVAYAPSVTGTALQIRVTGVRDGTTCVLWVLTGDGGRWRAGNWTVMPHHEFVWYDITVPGVPPASVRGFQITTAGKVMVNIPVT